MKFLKIKETCLYIHDLEKAKKFYCEILELPLISYVAGKHIFFRAGLRSSFVLIRKIRNIKRVRQHIMEEANNISR